MKKLSILTLIMALAIATKAQKSLTFKFKYQPKHTYNMAAKTGMEIEMVTINDSIPAGQSAPKAPEKMNMRMNNEWVASVKSGEFNAAQDMPYTMTGSRISSKMHANGQDSAFPVDNAFTGQTIHGVINPKGNLIPDTLDNSYITATPAVKYAMSFVMMDMPHPIKFPETKLKIGDTFTEDVTTNNMEITNIAFNKEFPVKYIYKLTAVKDNMAYFDTTSEGSQEYTVQDKDRTIVVKQKAQGTGKTVFNITTGYPQSVTNNQEIHLSAETGLKKMSAKFIRTLEGEYIVIAN